MPGLEGPVEEKDQRSHDTISNAGKKDDQKTISEDEIGEQKKGRKPLCSNRKDDQRLVVCGTPRASRIAKDHHEMEHTPLHFEEGIADRPVSKGRKRAGGKNDQEYSDDE